MVKLNYGRSNAFMIFGMLLLGFFLLLLLLIGDYINGGSFFKLNLLSKLSDLELKLLVLIVPLSVVVLYSIGFVIYLGSFIFLSGPGWLLMKKYTGSHLLHLKKFLMRSCH
tara:strand:+ start:210 stop:542 length:333 start_codon:yes stop_codon:yes gene_type:complete